MSGHNRRMRSATWIRVIAAFAAASLLATCRSSTYTAESTSDARVANGPELYQQHCASCHRPDLSGDPDWKTPNDDGSYPPPPHDSSGHTWHHSDRVLLEIVRNGSDSPQSRMPAFGDRLTDEDILAILEFIKTSWGPAERDYQQQVNHSDSP